MISKVIFKSKSDNSFRNYSLLEGNEYLTDILENYLANRDYLDDNINAIIVGQKDNVVEMLDTEKGEKFFIGFCFNISLFCLN